MADFSIASQIRPVQLPDQLQQYAQINQLALHQAQLAEVQRAANEQNQLRSLLESGVDRNSPEFFKQVYKISPTTGMTLEKGQAELQNAALTRRKTEGELALQPEALKKAQIENMQADHKLYSEKLNQVLALDDARAAPAYDMLRAGAVSKYKDLDTAWPATFDRGVLEKQMLTAEQAAKQQFELAKPQFQTIENPDGSKTIVRVAPGGGPATPVAGGTGAPKPAEAWSDTSGRRYQPIKNAAGEIIGQREVTPGVVGVPMTGATAPAAAPADLASNLLRRFEGFRETPYYDVNAYRTGYGSDTITQADGKVIKVQPGMQITKEDAERDLSRRLNTEFIPKATMQVGAENWTALPAPAQAALASVTYNYGSLPSSVVAAVKTGDVNAIADAVQALKDNPGRRAQEAAVIRGNGLIQSSATVPSMTMGQQFAVPGSVPGGLNALAPMAGVPAGGFNNLARPSALSLNPSIAGGAPAAAPVTAPAPTTKPPVLAEISPLEAEKRDAAQATAIRQYVAAQQALDEQIKNVQELKTHKGLSSITGTVAGHPYMPNFTQDAANAQELLTSITEKGKLEELLNLKAMGGSLGTVAVAEGEGLKKAHGVLGQRQDTQTFQGRVGQLESKLVAAKSALKDAFEQQYAYRGIPAPDVPGMPKVEMPKSAEPAETGVVRNEKGRRGTLNAAPTRPPIGSFDLTGN